MIPEDPSWDVNFGGGSAETDAQKGPDYSTYAWSKWSDW